VTEELLSNYQHVVDRFSLIPGRGGVFEVMVDGRLIFSKKTVQKRHAEPGEILRLFEEIVGPDVAKFE
jgi:selenoprotein W-related protein